jgi:hypothetical protein
VAVDDGEVLDVESVTELGEERNEREGKEMRR